MIILNKNQNFNRIINKKSDKQLITFNKYKVLFMLDLISLCSDVVESVDLQFDTAVTEGHINCSISVNPVNIFYTILMLTSSNLFCECNLIAITCIDNLVQDKFIKNLDKRFTLTYIFLDVKNNSRLNININFSEGYIIQSITSLFKSANWLEREIFDLFGIFFAGHKDLRRILTDYGFQGNPLKKDFPLTGYLELRYDEYKKYVGYKNIDLMQEFRVFNTESPWEKLEIVSFTL
jgi:NADH-quinone oxidoreductase subunit C